MFELLRSFWFLVKELIEGFVFVAEDIGKTGEEKKAAVVANAILLVEQLAKEWPKFPAWLLSLVKILIPFAVDAIVARLNLENRLLPHAAK